MNNYELKYTIHSSKPQHKKYTFDSDLDLLAAADEAMCDMLDKHPGKEILFWSIELINRREVYEQTYETASLSR